MRAAQAPMSEKVRKYLDSAENRVTFIEAALRIRSGIKPAAQSSPGEPSSRKSVERNEPVGATG